MIWFSVVLGLEVSVVRINHGKSEADRAEWDGKIYETLLDNNVWRPNEYPQGWRKIEGAEA